MFSPPPSLFYYIDLFISFKLIFVKSFLIIRIMVRLHRLEDVEKIKRIGVIMFEIPACRRLVSNQVNL
jgi:cytochrome c oxidase assembly factor CtaG